MNRILHMLQRPSLLWVGAAMLVATTVYFTAGGEVSPHLFSATEPQAQEAAPLEPPPPVKETPKPLSNRVVEYHISASLDAENKLLQATQTVTWTNPGQKAVDELYLHTYPNAFSSKQSTFIRESGGKLREDRMKEDSFGSMDISAIKLKDGRDITETLQYVQPDDGNKHDKTLAKLALIEPVAPGASVTLRMNYAVKLPAAFARMGYSGDYVMMGQWFPKLAVYEPAGTRGRAEEGWNMHQYHGNSEFYADFGIYNVRISVPADYTVAATGFPTKPPATSGDTKTYHFYADDVHDFAWAASPDFIYVEEPFSTAHVPGVKIKLYLDPAHADLKERYLTVAKKSLARFSEWYGPYPYSTLSIVVPPEDANGTGGMEYPSLVTAWGASEQTSGRELERVVAHEIGHQWFYGMIASNEFQEAWLDEGFTSYAEEQLMKTEYGVKSNLPLEASYITSPAPLKQNAWDYTNHQQYAENVYTRAKLVLHGIEKTIGEGAMRSVLKKYYQKWKFKHPDSKDFQNALEEVTKQSWEDYFQQFVYGGHMVDHRVESIRIQSAQENGAAAYESIVLIRKQDGHYGPVPIEFRFADGTSRQETWAGQEDQIQYRIKHSSPVTWVAVDPAHTIILENQHIDNFLKASIDEKQRIRWNIGVVKALELIFSWFTL
jgi:hypothetical protein